MVRVVSSKETGSSSLKKFNFSGKIEQSFKGKPEATYYYVGGKQVAKVDRKRRSGGGGGGGGGSAPVATIAPGVKEATLQFGDKESVIIKPEAITTTSQQILRQSAISPEAVKFIKTYGAKTPEQAARDILTPPTQTQLRVDPKQVVTIKDPFQAPTRSTAIYEPPLPREPTKVDKFVEDVKEKGLIPVVTPYVVERLKTMQRGVETLGRTPVLAPSYSKDEGIKIYSTVGKEVSLARERLRKTGEMSAEGWEDILRRSGVKTEGVTPGYQVPVYQRATLIGEPGKQETPTIIDVPETTGKTIPGMIPSLVKAGPEIIAYTTVPAITLGADVITSAEKSKEIKENVKAEVEKAYQEHLKEEVPEGYRHLTEGEFRQEVRPEIEKQLEMQNIVGFGASLAFLGGIAGFRAYRAAVKPRVKLFQAKPTAFTTEVRQPVITPKGRVDFSYYRTVQYRPPLMAQVTTKGREIFKMKPKIDWTPITKPQKYVSEPFAKRPIIGDQPYIGRIAKIGKSGKLGEPKFYAVQGQQIPLTPQEYMRLPRVEKYRLQRLVEQRVTGGRPVKMEDVPKYLKESQQLVLGEMKVVDLFKEPGKRISRYGVTTISEPAKEFQGARMYKTLTGTKDITKVFPRATGKIEVLPGKLVELPAIEVGKAGVNYIAPASVKKTPFQVTFQMQKTMPVFVPKIPKSRPPRAITEAVTKEIPTERPLMVGGTGLKNVPYTGRGVYEVNPVAVGKVPGGIVESTSFITVQRPVLTPRLTPRLSPRVSAAEKGDTKTGLIFKERLGVEEAGVLKPVLKERVILREMVRQRQRERLATKLKQKVKVTPVFRPVTPKPPKKPPVTIPKYVPKLDPTKKKKIRLEKRKRKELLVPYIRRRGEWIAISKPVTRKKAITKGLEQLRGTLAAALQLRKRSGKAVPFAKESREFRLAKKEGAITLVQRAPKRLSARREVSEIIAARAGGARFFK